MEVVTRSQEPYDHDTSRRWGERDGEGMGLTNGDTDGTLPGSVKGSLKCNTRAPSFQTISPVGNVATIGGFGPRDVPKSNGRLHLEQEVGDDQSVTDGDVINPLHRLAQTEQNGRSALPKTNHYKVTPDKMAQMIRAAEMEPATAAAAGNEHGTTKTSPPHDTLIRKRSHAVRDFLGKFGKSEGTVNGNGTSERSDPIPIESVTQDHQTSTPFDKDDLPVQSPPQIYLSSHQDDLPHGLTPSQPIFLGSKRSHTFSGRPTPSSSMLEGLDPFDTDGGAGNAVDSSPQITVPDPSQDYQIQGYRVDGVPIGKGIDPRGRFVTTKTDGPEEKTSNRTSMIKPRETQDGIETVLESAEAGTRRGSEPKMGYLNTVTFSSSSKSDGHSGSQEEHYSHSSTSHQEGSSSSMPRRRRLRRATTSAAVPGNRDDLGDRDHLGRAGHGPSGSRLVDFDSRSSQTLEDEVARMAEEIKRKRQSKRAREAAEAEASKAKNKQKEKEKEREEEVMVGNLIGQDHVNYVLMYNMLTGIRIGVSRCQAKVWKPITDADYRAQHKFSFDIVGNELTPSARYDFKFKDYAPWVFRELREFFHIDPADYLVSLTAKYILSELGSPGKSGSFFYFSRDYRFIIKTIHHAEHKFLRKILKHYHDHVRANPHTLLSRFYGLHRVKLPRGRKIHFVIMNNLFPPHRDVHETYDLKGSSVGREYPEEKALTNPKAVLKDLNWVKRGRKLELGPEKRAFFVEQLRRDTDFLKRLSIMDYSLLVGLHDLERGNSEGLREDLLSVFQPNTGQMRRMSSVYNNQKSEEEASALRNVVVKSDPQALGNRSLPLQGSSERRHFLFYQDDGGLRARDENNLGKNTIYYLGIIDCLTEYSWKKRGETAFRSMQYRGKADCISAVPPIHYGERFYRFICSAIKNSGVDPPPLVDLDEEGQQKINEKSGPSVPPRSSARKWWSSRCMDSNVADDQLPVEKTTMPQ